MTPSQRRRWTLTLAVASALVASPATAWSPIDSSQPIWSGAVPYQMNDAGSADLGVDTTESVVQQAFGDWTMVSCTSLRATYGGRTASRPSTGDGRAMVGWVESGWRYDTSAIGVTQPQWTSRTTMGHPTIVEADMELNGANYTWITGSGRGTMVNAYSIVLHEGGHYYGLGHSTSSSATMYYAYSGGIASLSSDDQTGICTLYPGTGVPPTSCTTTGCPTGQTCNTATGTCMTSSMMGTGGLCSPCSSAASCTNGYCLRYPDGLGYCGTNCSSDADCSGGSTCFAVSGLGGQCVQASGSCAGTTPSGCTNDTDCASGQRCNVATGACEAGSTSGGGLGAPCTTPDECSSNVCFGGVCSATCDWLDPTSCGTGFYCNGQATGTCTGTGLCEPGSAGSGAIGSACSANTDCAGLFCAEGVCTSPCVPGGATTSCPVGYACQVGSTASCGSCQMTGQIGDACSMGTDCASRICVNGACSQTCDPVSGGGCPDMFSCQPQGESGACVASSGGLGAPCHSMGDCLSGQCAQSGSSTFCTRTCEATAPCPRGYSCVATGDGTTRICQPRDSGSCGCTVAGGRGGAAGALAGLSVLALLMVGRRRAR